MTKTTISRIKISQVRIVCYPGLLIKRSASMAATQLVTPNLDPVIYQSGHALTDWYGWCLAYVQTAFGTGWAGSNATEAWTDHVPVSAKHEDSNIPSGMYVPIYFSGYHGLGHFGIYKDGQVWCTPIEHKPYADQWSSIAIVEQKYGVTYVGWCEILGGTQVIEYVADPVIAPIPPVDKYQIIETYPDGKQIQLNKQPTNLWGMNYDFDTMVKNPVEVHNQGEIWTVTNKVHHEDGYDYYRRDGQVDGFNVVDCTDYTPPPLPYVPPAPPVVVAPAETYALVTPVKTYVKDQDALSSVNSVSTLPAATYYVWNKTGNAYQLGTDNQHAPTNNWINILDNVLPKQVIPPVPAPVTTTPTPDSSSDVIGSFHWFHPDHTPEEYTVLKDIVVYDLVHGGKPVQIDAEQTIEIFGYFKKDGHTYLRPLTGSDQQALYYFYGILTNDPTTFSGSPNLIAKLNWVKKLEVVWESIYEKAFKSIDGVFRRKK